jgi:hypothetical protein
MITTTNCGLVVTRLPTTSCVMVLVTLLRRKARKNTGCHMLHLVKKCTRYCGLKYEGHFILQPSVEWTRDSSNLIGAKQKFVRSTFTLKANGQRPPKCLHDRTFWEFWRQEFDRWRKTCPQYLWKPKLSSNRQSFLSKLIQSLQFAYFNGLLPCPVEEVCPRPLRSCMSC